MRLSNSVLETFNISRIALVNRVNSSVCGGCFTGPEYRSSRKVSSHGHGDVSKMRVQQELACDGVVFDFINRYTEDDFLYGPICPHVLIGHHRATAILARSPEYAVPDYAGQGDIIRIAEGAFQRLRFATLQPFCTPVRVIDGAYLVSIDWYWRISHGLYPKYS
jgi:hypothetical protein